MSGDPCLDIRDRFSDRYEGRLGDDAAASFRSHLDACDACRAEWASFEAAVDALRDHAVPPLGRRELDAILGAVDDEARRLAGIGATIDDPRTVAFRRAMTGAGRVPGRGRPLLTHALAVAAGVAVATLPLAWRGHRAAVAPGTGPSTAIAPASAAPDVALELGPGSGRLLRDGRPIDGTGSEPVVPRPGDVLQVDPGDGLSLRLGDAGAIRIEAIPVTPPPARIVERPVPVETIRYVSRGPLVTIDAGVFEHAIGRFEGLVKSVGQEVSELVERSATPPREVRTEPPPRPAGSAPEPALPDVVEVTAPSLLPAARPEPPPVASAPESEPLPDAATEDLAAKAPRPVLVRRIGNRLRIETFGAPYEVIPDLIAHLDSGDPDVQEAARLRLEEIRDSLAADPVLAARLADPDPAPDGGGTLAFVKGLFGRETPPAPRSETESWQAWWERNAIHILGAGTWGTF